MKTIFLVFQFLALSSILFGQETFDTLIHQRDNLGYSYVCSEVSGDSNIIIVTSIDLRCIPLVQKVTFNFDTVQTRQFTLGGGLQNPYDLIITSDQGCLIVGKTYDITKEETFGYLLKLNKNLEKEWVCYFKGDYQINRGYSVVENADGSFICLGVSFNWNTYMNQYVFVKVSAAGKILWTVNRGFFPLNFPTNVCLTKNQDIIGIGTVRHNYDDTMSTYLFRIDQDGKVLHKKHTTNEDGMTWDAITPTNDGNFLVAGTSGASAPEYNYKLTVSKIDQDGEGIWTHTYSDPYYGINLYPIKIQQLKDRNFLVLAQNIIKGWNDDSVQVFLLKINSNGKQLWLHQYGSPYNDYSGDVCESKDGKLFITFGVENYWGTQDLYCAKLDKNGMGNLKLAIKAQKPVIEYIEENMDGYNEIKFKANEPYLNYKRLIYREVSKDDFELIDEIPGTENVYVDYATKSVQNAEKYMIKYQTDNVKSNEGEIFSSIHLQISPRQGDATKWDFNWNLFKSNHKKAKIYYLLEGHDAQSLTRLFKLDTITNHLTFKYPPNGSMFYQIEAVSLRDGQEVSIAKSNRVELVNYYSTEDQDPFLSTVYPNPCTGSFRFNNLEKFTSYFLYDASGKLIKSDRLSANENAFNISHLRNGNYYLIVKNDEVERVYKIEKH